MGCNSSKVNNSEVVWRCKKRKQMMSDAVKYRQQFAAAHLAYIEILQHVGHALSQYADRQLSDLEVTSGISVSTADPPSKPSQETSTKPPPSPSKSPAKSSPHASTPSQQQGPSHSKSDANVTKSVPVTRENSETFISNSVFSPNMPPLVQEFAGDVLMSSMPSSPIGGPSYYVLSQPSSPLQSEWDPFNLFSASPFRSPEQTMRYWDADSQAYDFVGVPELEDEDTPPKEEINEASKARSGQGPKKVNATESLAKPEKKVNATESLAKPEEKQIEVNAEKVLERIDEDPAEVGEGSPVDTPSKSQGTGAPQKGKDVASTMIDRVKQASGCVKKIKEAFARASESGHEVSQMLETQIVHRRARLRDFSDSFRLGNPIHKWQRSRKSVSIEMDFDELEDELGHDSYGSLSLTLETLYTWEKKLYKEVKVGEQLQVALSRKSKEFHSIDGKGKDTDLIEQCRADVKSLESQLMVAFRAISSASSRIQQVTTEELYPQLIELLKRLQTMWKAMLECHTTQKAVALEILTIEKSGHKFGASDAHRSAAVELENQLVMWQQCIYLWVVTQQKYIDTLLTWVRICHMEPESNVKRGAMSPAWTSEKAPIYLLARDWHDSLLRLEENVDIVDAVQKFVGMVHDIQVSESEELAEMKRAEMLSRSMDRRGQKRVAGQEQTQEDKNTSDKAQREDAVLSSLQLHLPSIFEALTTFSSVACREYEKVHNGADTSTKK